MGRANRRRQVGVLAALLALGAGVVAADPVGKLLTPLDGRQVQVRECTLGDLVADATRAAAKADLALVQATGIRDTQIPAGDVEEEALRGALLFPDEQVVVVQLKADKIRAALERGLSVLPQRSTAFLQVSGLAVTFHSTRPEGQRVESITLGGQPLAPDKDYKVAVPASLAKGTLGYFRVFKGTEAKQTGVSLGQAVNDYVRASKAISITAGQRLRDLAAGRPAGGPQA
jgi:2',3'-cyclic-nucleotide 2'-phosphodiesterase (5'-nucleotidase family)